LSNEEKKAGKKYRLSFQLSLSLIFEFYDSIQADSNLPNLNY